MSLFDKEWVNIRAGQAWAENLVRNERKLKKDMGLKYALQLANSIRLREGSVGSASSCSNRIHWDETALAAARMIKDRDAEVLHLHTLGIAYSDLGETGKAIEFYESSLSGKSKIEFGINEGRLLTCLGVAIDRQDAKSN